tara:strand:- start:45 stop:434 length:390 start_codon:yes stop_codon:yes gene_type:complete
MDEPLEKLRYDSISTRIEKYLYPDKKSVIPEFPNKMLIHEWVRRAKIYLEFNESFIEINEFYEEEKKELNISFLEEVTDFLQSVYDFPNDYELKRWYILITDFFIFQLSVFKPQEESDYEKQLLGRDKK